MKEIFQEYGGILITVVAILSIILVVTAVIGSDATGIVGKTFSDLITNFSNHADRKSTRLNSSHKTESRMPSSA